MKVLIMGVGSIGRKHIAALRCIDPQCEIVALRSSRTATAIEGVRNVYSIDEVKDQDIDFAIISTPTSSHIDSIKEAAKIGCPLFIEKPVYHRLCPAKTIEELAPSGQLTYVACNLRFLECLAFIKDAIATRGKRINEVNSYCGSYLPSWRPGADYRQVYSARPEMGGGVHIDLIHELDYIYWMFGKPLSVAKTLRSNSTIGIEAIDYANYCLAYPDFCASVVLNYYRRDYKRTLEIVWEDETWLADLAANTVTRAGGDVIFHSDRTILDTYQTQLRYFINLVKDNSKASSNTVNDAFDVLKICLDYESEK